MTCLLSLILATLGWYKQDTGDLRLVYIALECIPEHMHRVSEFVEERHCILTGGNSMLNYAFTSHPFIQV